jgi:hypothetical protein
MRYLHAHNKARKSLIATFSTLAAASMVLAASPAMASPSAAPTLLYKYDFAGTTGTVANSAPGGPVAPLTLQGSWFPVTQGVKFRGNVTGGQSVAFGKPATGFTLNEPSTAAVGVGTQIVFQGPGPGKCFTSTPNITQIGLYSAKNPSGQIKLQESGCTVSHTAVKIECRITGATTLPTSRPVVSKLPLVNGDTYDITCVKSPDNTAGTATITLTVTQIQGSVTVTNKFKVPALGAMQTKRYISAGNKYPLPTPAQNTDQFNGVMSSTIYCAGLTTAVNSCLSANLP